MKNIDFGGSFSGGTVPNDTTFSGNVQVDGTLGVTGAVTFTSTLLASDTITTAVQNAMSVGPYGAGAGATGEVRFLELAAGGVNYVGFKAPDALAGNTVYTLPDAFPASNKILQSTGAGVLTWETAAAAGATTALDNLASVAVNTAILAADDTLDFGAAGQRWTTGFFAAIDCSGAADTIGASLDAATGLRLGSGKVLNFSSTTAFDGAADLGLKRSAAGILQVTDGSAGSGKLLVLGGTAASPGVQVGSASYGLYQTGTSLILTTAGAARLLLVAGAVRTGSGEQIAFSSDVDPAAAGSDAGMRRVSAGVIGFCGSTVTTEGGIQAAQSSNAASMKILSISELVTLDTGAAFTDTTANLLPANAIIHSVVARITTTITTATTWQLGDPTTAGRFTTTNATLTANTTDYGYIHRTTGVASATTGMVQTTAGKVRITLDGNPGAGAVRVTVFYSLLVAPTS